MLELIILIVAILLIVREIGRNSSGKDYDSVQYHKDWDREYNKWKMRGVDDNTAHANSFKSVQKDKKDGKYDK